ncbi:MAG: MBL fold metallo-hydrolase [Eubacteriales bacterium]|nr:MBL fold metallo-hydrolase [Eubacteriales bacterium]
MIIKALVEDTTISPELSSEHGLSLYIEANDKKILFDMGAGSLFLENAEKMGVRIQDVEVAIISHGHYDHGGGLKTFLEINKKACVYVHKSAFDSYFSIARGEAPVNAGIDPSLKPHERVRLTDGNLLIDSGLELFSDVTGREYFSSCNDSLYMDHNGSIAKDDFRHEQNLLIREDGETALIAGCAHNGIVNIMKRVYNMNGSYPDAVISGFHLMRSSTKKSEAPEVIEGIAKFLKSTESRYYTGHCTGPEAYRHLKEVLGDRIQYLATGTVIEI